MKSKAQQFRSPAQYALARAMNMHGYRIDLTQEALDYYKIQAMNTRKTEKARIILELLKNPGEYGLPEIEIADISAVSAKFARKFLEIGLVNVAQLAEFNVNSSNEILRYRNFGRLSLSKTEKLILNPYNIPYLHRISDGFGDIGIDITQLNPEILDILASNRFNLLELAEDPSLFKIKRQLSHISKLRLEDFVKGFKRIPFAPDFALVDRSKL